MGEYALTDEDGICINRIVADQEFIDALPAQISDPSIDTGVLQFTKAYEVTGKGVAIGHKRSQNGKWSAPVPTAAEIEAQQRVEDAAQARLEDDKFLEALDKKIRGANASLTAAEQARLDIIKARRS